MPNPTRFPGGLADDDGRIGCVASPDGGSEILDLVTGEHIASLAAPQLPLFVDSGRVLSWRAKPDRVNVLQLFSTSSALHPAALAPRARNSRALL